MAGPEVSFSTPDAVGLPVVPSPSQPEVLSVHDPVEEVFIDNQEEPGDLPLQDTVSASAPDFAIPQGQWRFSAIHSRRRSAIPGARRR